MKFNYPIEKYGTFEIPDEWIIKSGAERFIPRRIAYTAAKGDLLKLIEIVPPSRILGVGDCSGLKREKAIPLLKAVVSETHLPPIKIEKRNIYKNVEHIVRNGYHRYHISIALGFTHIPCEIFSPEDFIY